MQKDVRSTIETHLSSPNPDEVARGLAMARAQIPEASAAESGELFEMVSALFYIDPLDRPDLVPALEEAIVLVAGLGPWVIPTLIQNLEGGDVKAQMAIAQALGWMGAPAIGPLMAEYRSCPETTCHAFILYALGKVKAPQIIEAVPVALDAAGAPDLELRDSATRAIGKFAESIPVGALPDDLRAALVDRLRRNLADPNAGVRSKAVRSLGKLARYGHLTPEEIRQAKVTLHRILGEDEHFDWDRAYVVRKEAREALGYV